MAELSMGELFAGMCGFGAGFSLSGIRSLWHVEIDRDAQKVIRKHNPDAQLFSDVREVNGATLTPVDIITFGSPCQDLSVAGKRAGLAGERSGLFFKAVRIIREMRESTDGRFPRLTVWENVPGAKSSNQGRDFGAALDALAECGAVDLGWRFINAEHWNPQRRSRVFIIACFPPFATGRAGTGRAAEILALAESVRRNPQPRRATGQDLAGTLGGGAGKRGWSSDTDRMTFIPETVGALLTDSDHNAQYRDVGNLIAYVPEVAYSLDDATGTRPGSGRDAQDTFVAYAIRGTLANGRSANKGGPGGTGDAGPSDPMWTLNKTEEHAVAYAVRTGQTGANGIGVAEEAAHTLDLAGAQAVAMNIGFNWQDSGGPAAIAEGSPTLRNGSQPAVLTGHWIVRRLTPLECLRLQGFPDDYVDGLHLSDAAVYRLTGNAVNRMVAAWLGQRIAGELAQVGAL